MDDLTPLLDEAIARLNQKDRAGVLLSYFGAKTYREVGDAMGISEEAARKRVTRAIEKMRAFFMGRGIDATGATVANSLQGIATATVPGALLHSITAAAIGAAGHTGAAVTSAALIKGVNHMLAMAKLKAAAIYIAACVVIGGGSAAIVVTARAAQNPPATQPGAPPAASAGPVDAQAGGADLARFDDDATAEILGLTGRAFDGKWWHGNGAAAEAACDPSSSQDDPPHSHQICLRVTGVSDDADVLWFVGSGNYSSQPATKGGAELTGGTVTTFSVPEGAKTVDVACHIATGPWTMLLEHNSPADMWCTNSDRGGFVLSGAYESHEGTCVVMGHDLIEEQVRLVAIDGNGGEHVGKVPTAGSTKKFKQCVVIFDVPLAQLARLQVQIRPYNHRVEFKNVTLDPGNKTKVEMKIESPK